MCPWINSTSKNEYQDNLGGKGGRCVRLTTYHLHVPIVKKSGGLNLLEPCGPVQACNGTALPLPFTMVVETRFKTVSTAAYVTYYSSLAHFLVLAFPVFQKH
jgi:hypothetical protein